MARGVVAQAARGWLRKLRGTHLIVLCSLLFEVVLDVWRGRIAIRGDRAIHARNVWLQPAPLA